MIAIQHKKLTLMMLASGLALAACAGPAYHTSATPAIASNPIQISESIERLELYSRPNGMSLSARDRDAVASFIDGFARYGDGPLYMNVPRQAAQGMGAQQAQNIVRQTMAGMGLSAGGIQTGQYMTRPGAPAPVVVSFRRLKAVPRDCRRLGNLMETNNNQAYDGFGCAYQSNLAAMIDNPRQLLEPNPMDISNAERRRVVYDKYIKGENPASDHPDRQELSAEER